MAKRLTKPEARGIILNYLIAWTTMLTDTREDFYEGISEYYLFDKSRTEEIGHGLKEYLPSKNAAKLIAKEADDIFHHLNKMLKTERRKYLKNCSSHQPIPRRTKLRPIA